MNQDMKPVIIIGMGLTPSDLTDAHRKIIQKADILIGGKRHLAYFEDLGVVKKEITKDLKATVAYIQDQMISKRIVVLTSGDPLFYGIGSKIMDAMPEAEVELLPALSCVQVAFSRVGLSWQDAEFVSLHGSVRRKWTADDLPLLCERYPKLVILTGGENTPSKLARKIHSASTVYVLERLGYPDERVSEGTPQKVSKMEFKDPNLMIVLTPASAYAYENSAPVFGLNEQEFAHERSLITKDEVRAVGLHKLRLPIGSSGGVFWDVGAGSGSVGIEARRLSPGMRVYAIERDPARARDIRHNASVLRAGEINIVEGEAPEVFKDIPAPDRVFIGGGGTALKEIINASFAAMEGGIIVVSTITIESLSEAVAAFKSLGLAPEVTSLSVSRSKDVGGREYLKAENQIFLIKVEKRDHV